MYLKNFSTSFFSPNFLCPRCIRMNYSFSCIAVLWYQRGEVFTNFIFYDKWWTPNFWAEKLIFHVELERYFLNLCSAFLVVIFFWKSLYTTLTNGCGFTGETNFWSQRRIKFFTGVSPQPSTTEVTSRYMIVKMCNNKTANIVLV